MAYTHTAQPLLGPFIPRLLTFRLPIHAGIYGAACDRILNLLRPTRRWVATSEIFPMTGDFATMMQNQETVIQASFDFLLQIHGAAVEGAESLIYFTEQMMGHSIEKRLELCARKGNM
jgi:hypothetical protein